VWLVALDQAQIVALAVPERVPSPLRPQSTRWPWLGDEVTFADASPIAVGDCASCLGGNRERASSVVPGQRCVRRQRGG
jgi:hypothetical protein